MAESAYKQLMDQRRRNLATVLERHPAPDSPELAEVTQAAIEGHAEGWTRGYCPAFAVVAQHVPDGDYVIGLRDVLDEALDLLAGWHDDGPVDGGQWTAHAAYNLQTGKCLPLNIRTVVAIAVDDQGAATEADLADEPCTCVIGGYNQSPGNAGWTAHAADCPVRTTRENSAGARIARMGRELIDPDYDPAAVDEDGVPLFSEQTREEAWHGA